MTSTLFISMINNAMLLLILSVVYELINMIPYGYSRFKLVLNGLLISLICVTIMSMPYMLQPGLFFDTRSILISVTALIFGPIPTAFTVITASIYRIIVGGSGTLPGLAVILTSTLIGLAWRRWLYPKATKWRWLSVYLMSFAVHVTMLACMLLLPYPQNLNTILAIAVPVLVVYPITSALLSILLLRLQEANTIREQLKQSEERFRALFDQAPLGYQSLDIDGNFIDVNQQWLNTLGYTRNEVRGKWFGDFLSPAYREVFRERFPVFKAQGYIHSEFEMLHKNGKVVFIAFEGRIGYESDGKFKQTHCILQDITEQKAAQEHLRESEKKYRRLYETMSQGIVYQAADGKIISANPTAERLLGMTFDQMQGKTSMDPQWKAIREDGSEVLGTEFPVMIALRTGKPFGPFIMGVFQPEIKEHVWLSITATPLFRSGETVPFQAYALFQDITAERKAQQDFQLLFHEMIDAFALHEIICNDRGQPVDYRFLAVNPAFENMTGRQSDTILGKTVMEVFPNTEFYWIETYGRVALTGKPEQFENYSIATDKYFSVSAYQPKPNQFACTFTDITEHKQYEVQLKQNMDDLLQSQRIAHLGKWRLNIATNQVVWSEELYRMYGFDPTVPPPPYTEHMKLFTLESWERLSAALQQTRTSGISYELELETVTKDGSNGWMWVRGEAEKDSNGNITGLRGAAQDITERKKSENELLYLSYHDQLTGIYNRRFFEEELKRIDIQENYPLSLVMCDVNGLKLINDSFGHDMGDRLLIKVAEVLRQNFPAGDVIARVGGDEFVIILPKITMQETAKIINDIEHLEIDSDIANIKVSISFGFDTKTTEQQNIVDVLANAENYMYMHKLSEKSSMRSNTIEIIMNTLFEKSNRELEHSQRVSKLCQEIAIKMQFEKDDVNQIRIAGLVHDIGKIGIDEKILNKVGRKLSQ